MTGRKMIALLSQPEPGSEQPACLLAWPLFHSWAGRASPAQPPNPQRVTYCSKQDLLPPHLTARETLALFSALWGQSDPGRVDEILRAASLEAYADHPRIGELPRATRRALLWALAALSDPDALLVDHLTDNLSPSARLHLLRLIRAEQTRRPRTILFATADLETARTLGEEVWWVEKGMVTRRWRGVQLPAPLQAAAGYAFEFKTARAARRFLEATQASSEVLSRRLRPPRTVEILTASQERLVDLTWMAGHGLESLRSMSLQTRSLPSEWVSEPSPSGVFPVPFALAEILPLHAPGGSFRRWAAIRQLALAEWRMHFRSFWKAGNLILSGLFLLIALAAVLPAFETLEGFLRWAPAPLSLSSMIVLGLGMESINRLVNVGQAETLFRPAEGRSSARPLSLLAMYDLTAAGRGTVLAGATLGQVCLALAHAWPLLFFGVAVWMRFPQPAALLASSLLYWLLTLAAALALNFLVGSLLGKPGRGVWLGWLLWLLIPLTGYLPERFSQPWLWLWPYAGFTAAFGRLNTPTQAVLPFALGLSGAWLLGAAAWRIFRARPACWGRIERTPDET